MGNPQLLRVASPKEVAPLDIFIIYGNCHSGNKTGRLRSGYELCPLYGYLGQTEPVVQPATPRPVGEVVQK
jgi:hypothetical protein